MQTSATLRLPRRKWAQGNLSSKKQTSLKLLFTTADAKLRLIANIAKLRLIENNNRAITYCNCCSFLGGLFILGLFISVYSRDVVSRMFA